MQIDRTCLNMHGQTASPSLAACLDCHCARQLNNVGCGSCCSAVTNCTFGRNTFSLDRSRLREVDRLCVAGCPAVTLRVPGERSIYDYPEYELAALILHLRRVYPIGLRTRENSSERS